jgi:hypothetical protein
MVLGLLSVSTAKLDRLLDGFFGQTIELGIAGMFAGDGLGGARLGKLFLLVVGLIILLFLITVVMQSVGIAPTLGVQGPSVT